MKLRRFIAYIWFVLLPVSLPAQEREPERAVLWEITGGNLERPSYLFATVHISEKEVLALSDSVLISLDACDIYAGEWLGDSAIRVMLAAYVERSMQDIAESRMHTDSLRRLWDSLALEQQNGIEDATENHSHEERPDASVEDDDGADQEEMDDGTDYEDDTEEVPWILFDHRLRAFFGLTPERIVDDHIPLLDGYLYGHARRRGKPRVALETVEEQKLALRTFRTIDSNRAA